MKLTLNRCRGPWSIQWLAGGPDDPGKVFPRPHRGKTLLGPLHRPDPLWGLPILIVNRYWGIKQPGREHYHSPAFIAECRIAYSYISKPLVPPGLAQGEFHFSPLRKILLRSAVFHLKLSLHDVFDRIFKTVQLQCFSLIHAYLPALWYDIVWYIC
jgi:hypothetical protein